MRTVEECFDEESENLQTIWELAKKHLKKGRWVDLSHTQIVIDFARRLCNDLGGNPKIVLPAAMLHDVGFSFFSGEPDLEMRTTMPSIPPYSLDLKLGHLVKGAELTREILMEANYENEIVNEIVWIVRNHEKPDDSREFLNLNQAIVSDADALSRVTDAGINYLVEIYSIDELEIMKKILEVYKSWFITERAKKIAEEELKKLKPYLKLRGMWTNGKE